jgi:hypothetical protein
MLVVAGLAVVGASQAAAVTFTTLDVSTWAYADSALPSTSFVNPSGPVPVGAYTYADGTTHVSKSYLTFDISALRGHQVINAEMVAQESTVADCSTARVTQAWLTAPAKTITWNKQPAELTRLPGPGSQDVCPSTYIEWSATAALQSALDAGRSKATIALRLPDDRQADPRFARSYVRQVKIYLQYNRIPAKPTEPMTNGRPCAGEGPVLARSALTPSAVVTDADGDWMSAEFAWWPLDHPNQRGSRTVGGTIYSGSRAEITLEDLADDTAYGWQVRALDAFGAGPWSAVCKFSTDFIRPDRVPTVTSTDYPIDGGSDGSGGSGIPGSFTFSANGAVGVTGFYWADHDSPSTYVPANRNGKAVITYTPNRSGPRDLTLFSVDAAGNRSDSTRYPFFVPSNEPAVACTPELAYPDVARQCTFEPRGAGTVTGYVYTYLGLETSVPAGADGRATVTITPTNADRFVWASVRSRLANGNLTGGSSFGLAVDLASPTVDIPSDVTVGQPFDVTFHAVLPNSSSLTYEWEGDYNTVPIWSDGSVTVRLVPRRANSQLLRTFTSTESGARSGVVESYIQVATDAPQVSSLDYPEYGHSGGVGVPGTFSFTSRLPGVVSYTYRFNDTPPVTVAADLDGSAGVVLTPIRPYSQVITVTSNFADGGVSYERQYYFSANSVSPDLACEIDGYLRPGQQVPCTVTARQPGAVAVQYLLGTHPEVTVPLIDGAARVTLAIPQVLSNPYLTLRVTTTNSIGQRSDEYVTTFYVDLT